MKTDLYEISFDAASKPKLINQTKARDSFFFQCLIILPGVLVCNAFKLSLNFTLSLQAIIFP